MRSIRAKIIVLAAAATQLSSLGQLLNDDFYTLIKPRIESAATSEEIASQAAMRASTAGNLASQAERMQAALWFFRLGDKELGLAIKEMHELWTQAGTVVWCLQYIC